MTLDQYKRESNILGKSMTKFWKYHLFRIAKKYPALSKRDIDAIIENSVKFFIVS